MAIHWTQSGLQVFVIMGHKTEHGFPDVVSPAEVMRSPFHQQAMHLTAAAQ